MLFWIWFRKTFCCNHGHQFPQKKLGKKEKKNPWMNRNSCLIQQKLKQKLYKKIYLACCNPSIRIHNVWISFFVHFLFTWNNAFACEWRKAKLYSKVHVKKLLIGSLIGQTPSEPLSLFSASTLTETFSSVTIMFVMWSSKLV